MVCYADVHAAVEEIHASYPSILCYVMLSYVDVHAVDVHLMCYMRHVEEIHDCLFNRQRSRRAWQVCVTFGTMRIVYMFTIYICIYLYLYQTGSSQGGHGIDSSLLVPSISHIFAPCICVYMFSFMLTTGSSEGGRGGSTSVFVPCIHVFIYVHNRQQ